LIYSFLFDETKMQTEEEIEKTEWPNCIF